MRFLMGNRRQFAAVVSLALIVSCAATAGQSESPSASDEVTLRIVVVSSAEAAQLVADRLHNGEDFSMLAKQESIDATSDEGGLMGKVNLSMLRPELRDALRGVKVGQISPVVRVPLGFAVLIVVKEGENAPSPPASPAVAATGSVKYTFNLGGLGEAELGLSKFDKPAGWEQDLRKICEVRKQSIAAEKQSLQDFLSPASHKTRASYPPIDVLNAHFSLGELFSYEGNMDAAVEQYQAAYQIAESEVPNAMLHMNEALGIAYLHKSEMENDVYRAPGERCLLPMRPGAAYAKPGDSQKAVEYFSKYLEQKPEELEVRWLLNLTYMTLGTYPEKVPPQFLISTSVFASAEDVGRFPDVAPQAGLDSFSTAGGLIVDDFENNGRFDVVTSSFDSCGPMHFFHNNGDGTFAEQGAKAGLADQLGGLNIVQADYNNDGCTDILVLRGAWEAAQRKSLLRNNCDGTFTDVTVASGLAEPAMSSQAAVWVDINNDGFLSPTKTAPRNFSSTKKTAHSKTSRWPPTLIASCSARAWPRPTMTTTVIPTSTFRI
jgi:tetratricopeptide (TPR) repeat protein